MNLKRHLIKNYVNFRGKSLWGRKIVLIESDDWGSIRMPSREVYNKFIKAGINVDEVYFDKYDSLESESDLVNLFTVISSIKDCNGRNAIIAPYTLVANPDYSTIRANNKEYYAYESVLDTYKQSKDTENAYSIIQQGIAQGIWDPQFHGREHVNIRRWMSACQRGDKNVDMAFDNHAFLAMAFPKDLYCFPAFDYDNELELPEIERCITSGVELFKELYKRTPVSICPPCGMANKVVFKAATNKGIHFVPGQLYTHQKDGSYKKSDHFWGERFDCESVFYRRNCKFEPSNPLYSDPVNSCLSDIAFAFRWGKPAVIDSHRVNYIGSIFPENRERSLRLLKELLNAIVKNWPDVEFLSVREIYELYNNR